MSDLTQGTHGVGGRMADGAPPPCEETEAMPNHQPKPQLPNNPEPLWQMSMVPVWVLVRTCAAGRAPHRRLVIYAWIQQESPFVSSDR